MTKLRPPLSIEDALHKVFGALTLEVVAELTGRAPAYLRDLTDPDKSPHLLVRDLIKLDLGHRQAGHAGAPLYETLGLILKAADAEIFSDAAALGQIAVRVIKEGGEANVALYAATRPGVTTQQLQQTQRELVQSAQEHAEAIAAVGCMIEQRRARPP